MNGTINIICKLEFLKKSQVTSLLSNSSGEGIITFSGNALEVPISKSSGRFNCQSDRSAAGICYNINISARLKESLGDLEPGIYLVTIDDKTTYIIGSEDYPAKYSSSESLTEKSFEISYKSLTKPLKRHI